MIPETIIERSYGSQVDENGNKIKHRDVNRSPNVTDRREEYINTHNEALPENSATRLLWFSDTLSNRQRQKRAKSIIRMKLVKYLRPEWFNGSMTFNVCQLEHGMELETCIEEINSVPVMAVYAQTERNWAVRRLMEDMFAIRRRTYLKNKKLEDVSDAKDGSLGMGLGQEPISEKVDQTKTKEQMTDVQAAMAAVKAFESLEAKEKSQLSSDPSEVSDDVEAKKENISDIEEQIAVIKKKKKLLQGKRAKGNKVGSSIAVDAVLDQNAGSSTDKRKSTATKKRGGSKKMCKK